MIKLGCVPFECGCKNYIARRNSHVNSGKFGWVKGSLFVALAALTLLKRLMVRFEVEHNYRNT